MAQPSLANLAQRLSAAKNWQLQVRQRAQQAVAQGLPAMPPDASKFLQQAVSRQRAQMAQRGPQEGFVAFEPGKNYGAQPAPTAQFSAPNTPPTPQQPYGDMELRPQPYVDTGVYHPMPMLPSGLGSAGRQPEWGGVSTGLGTGAGGTGYTGPAIPQPPMPNPAAPYGTSYGQANPYQAYDPNNAAYGADHTLNLADLGTAGLSTTDQQNLAGQGLYFNPGSQDAYNNAQAWGVSGLGTSWQDWQQSHPQSAPASPAGW